MSIVIGNSIPPQPVDAPNQRSVPVEQSADDLSQAKGGSEIIEAIDEAADNLLSPLRHQDSHLFGLFGPGSASAYTDISQAENGVQVSMMVDRNGDGQSDGHIQSLFDEEGNLTEHRVSLDNDFDGVWETSVESTDLDANGVLDFQTTTVVDEFGRTISQTEASDLNQDGLVDFGITRNFDQAGNATSVAPQLFEGGLFSSFARSSAAPQTQMPGATSHRYDASGALLEDTLGPASLKVSRNEAGGLTVETHVDVEGDGELEGFFLSQFDAAGTLRVKEAKEDHNNDGLLDNTEYSVYDEQGGIVSREQTFDQDRNGIVESALYLNAENGPESREQRFDNETGILSFQREIKVDEERRVGTTITSEDADLSGAFEHVVTDIVSEESYTRIETIDSNEDGFAERVTTHTTNNEGAHKHVALDENSDGVVDIIEEEFFDEQMNSTAHQITYTDDGVYQGQPPQLGSDPHDPPSAPESPDIFIPFGNSLINDQQVTLSDRTNKASSYQLPDLLLD